jgi:hypothetical protein
MDSLGNVKYFADSFHLPGQVEVAHQRLQAGGQGIVCRILVFGGCVLCMGVACNFWNSASVFALLWLVISLTVASIRTQYDTQDRAVTTHIATQERADIAFRSK